MCYTLTQITPHLCFNEALLHETGSAVLASWFFGLRFFCNRIGLGFGQREQSVKHRTTHPCFGLLVR